MPNQPLKQPKPGPATKHAEVAELSELVKSFESLDKRVLSEIKAGNIRFLLEVVAAKNAVKDFMSERHQLRLTSTMSGRVRRIRDDRGYAIDELSDVVGLLKRRQQGEDFLREFMDDDDVWGYAFDYKDLKREVGALIATQSLPPTTVHHLRRIAECYSLGLFDATVVFCRAVIETSLYEFLKRKRLIRSAAGLTDQAEYKSASLRERSKRYLSRETYWAACGPSGVVKLADKILHAKQEPESVGREQAREAVRATHSLLEEVFA